MYALAPGLHVASYEDECVVLDLQNDSYLCLGSAASSALAATLSHDPGVELDDVGIKNLVNSKILVPATQRSSYRIAEPAQLGGVRSQRWAPGDSAYLSDSSRATGRGVLSAVARIAQADKKVRRNGTFGLVSWLERHSRKVKGGDEHSDFAAELGNLVKSHLYARMIYPRYIACLAGSAALAQQCWQRNIAVDFVIGVQKYPFFAHAWVQYQGNVVNDGPDPATRLAPILTITPLASSTSDSTMSASTK